MATARPTQRRRPTAPEYTFSWEGRDRMGKALQGEMRAAGEAMVATTLRRQGIVPGRIRKRSMARGGKVTEKDITLFTRQLSTMMQSGVPLLQAFDIVAKGTTKPAVARLFTDIKSDVETGSALSQAFRRYPLYFDAMFCNLVGAGEQAGILDELLERLAIYKEKIQAIRSKVKSAMFYPTAVVFVAFIVVAVIMIFVVPKFKEVFKGFGADLPAPTQAVVWLSDAFVDQWYIIFGILGASIYFVRQAWRRSVKVQMVMDRVLLRIPLLGPLVEKATVARWLRTLSTMFAAGVPLVEALDSVGAASGNHIYTMATRQLQQDVSTGTSLTTGIQRLNLFPDMVVQMALIGEESGRLETMLAKAADIYDREVDDAVNGLSSLIEPMIMVFLGTLIGGLVVAMYLPIFKMGQVV